MVSGIWGNKVKGSMRKLSKFLKELIGFKQYNQGCYAPSYKGYFYYDFEKRMQACVWLPLAPFARLFRAAYLLWFCIGIDAMRYYEKQLEIRKRRNKNETN
jgi:hypothetical protein